MRLRDELRYAWDDGRDRAASWWPLLGGALEGLLVALVYLAGVLAAPARRRP